jgi:hypothetical protein
MDQPIPDAPGQFRALIEAFESTFTITGPAEPSPVKRRSTRRH